MKRFILVFAMITSLFVLAGASHASGFYVYDGANVTQDRTSDPQRVKNVKEWQVWLYKRGVPTSQFGFTWGVISGPSAENVMKQLKNNQNFEKRYEKWCQCGPTSLTYFNPLGPIAVIEKGKKHSDRVMGEYTTIMDKINRLASFYNAMSVAMFAGDTLRNPFEGTGLTMMGYFEGYADAFKMQAKLRQKLDVVWSDENSVLSSLGGMLQELNGAEQQAQRFQKAVNAGGAPAAKGSPELNNDLLSNAADGNVANIRALISKGADVNAREPDGTTSLIYAAQEGHIEAARVLLEKGAKPNQVMNDNVSALMHAIRANRPDIVRLLLEKGADPNARTSYGKSVLQFSAETGNADIEGLLRKAGARR